MPLRRTAVVAGVLSIALLLTGLTSTAEPTDAAWTAPQMATAQVTAGIAPPVTGVLKCTTKGLLGIVVQEAEITWTPVPGVSKYIVWVFDPTAGVWKEFTRTNDAKLTLNQGLLGLLLGGVLNLLNDLLGGPNGYAELRVSAVLGTSNWESEISTGYARVKRSASLLGGYACYP